ncbi:hypothetical protein C2S53_005637 [Perilla frutescens var. hirtella]|uniref:RRM domain-containing protein n=1 Tax=Perilla frutescens var. hirtella TaxID=608512 RepID=A0AAD4JEF1_PERFH|nr:hypothetical protein C2S51_020636 [Perilla frutescens var. frutescens]KAH6832288.1 hypothetical protein C2S53_005637 [Perilla frutescens var. hirtella]
MSFAAKAILRPTSMATNGCLASLPSLFTTSKASYSHPYLSISSKPIKIQISCSYASSIPLSLKRKEPILRVSVIAAQQEEDIPVLLEEQEGDFNSAEGRDSDADGGDSYGFQQEEAKLYVGNFPYDIDGERLAQIFQQAGTVEMAEIITNKLTGQSRGFGFVTMSTMEEVDKALEMFHRYDLNGRFLTVSKATKKGSKPPPTESPRRVYEPRSRIYVGNLPWSVDDARLEEVFSDFGEVVSAHVVFDRETSRSRGFGFVVMSSEAEMNDAIANLDGQNLDGRSIRVNVAADRPARRSF